MSNSREQCQNSEWLVNSGESEHMTCHRALFSFLSAATILKSVIVGNGEAISELGYG